MLQVNLGYRIIIVFKDKLEAIVRSWQIGEKKFLFTVK